MSQRTRALLIVCSLLGLIYCLLNALGAELLCGTLGCEIYAGYGAFGLSFYIYGALGFWLVGALAWYSPRPRVLRFLRLLLGTLLFLDAFFLIYQYLFWPCSSCLVVAVLFALCALCGGWHMPLPGRRLLAAVAIFWGIFFIFASLAALKEMAFRPWPVYGNPEAAVKVYFSPVCPACRETVAAILSDSAVVQEVALYPVVKEREDRERLAAVLAGGADPLDRQGVLSLFEPVSSPPQSLAWPVRLGLLSNKILLARMGVTRVPLVVSPAWPHRAVAPDGLGGAIEDMLQGANQGCGAFGITGDCAP